MLGRGATGWPPPANAVAITATPTAMATSARRVMRPRCGYGATIRSFGK